MFSIKLALPPSIYPSAIPLRPTPHSAMTRTEASPLLLDLILKRLHLLGAPKVQLVRVSSFNACTIENLSSRIQSQQSTQLQLIADLWKVLLGIVVCLYMSQNVGMFTEAGARRVS